ncbi:MAG: VanZ family protein [Candidatus Electrothrix sp. GW3-4]|uniref:VanZ family protein n=1 Tax=Candidatus Electrothrix sp. GW3-4 TaxID=3126740 RepID=UPI0030CDBB25
MNTLSNALLIYFIFIVLIITLIPFNFQIPNQIEISWHIGPSDTITNIFLFIPLGFLFRLIHRHKHTLYSLPTFFFGAFLSITIEISQIFSPSRYTNPIDVLTNGFGAWLGAIALNMLSKKIREKERTKIFDLELPLLGQVYLLIPLLWLNGLALGDDPTRLLLIFLLGLSGSFVLGMIWKNRWMQHKTFSPKRLSLITVCWFMIGVLPSFFRYPLQIMGQVVLIGIFTMLLMQILQKITLKERRIEQRTLQIVFPLYIFYLALATYWSNLPARGNIHDVFQGVAFNKRIEVIFLAVELVASYTLMGYMIAGLRGRQKDSQGYTFGLAFFIALTTSLLTDLTNPSSSIADINISRTILVGSMSLYGALIYSLQLNAIQRLRKKPHKDYNHANNQL